jgi:hypothetical protein
LLLAGCGKVSATGSDGGDDDGGDGSEIDAQPAPDAPPDSGPPACVWTVPSPEPFGNDNTDGREEWPSLTGDGLAVFFTVGPADLSAVPDIFDAARDAVDQPFGSSRRVTGLAGAPGEYEIEISPGAEELFFLQDGTDEILTTARPFGEVRTTGLAGFSPSVPADGLALYFLDLDRTTILRSRRGAIGEPWQPPERVGDATGFQWIDVSADELGLLLSGGGPARTTVAIAQRQRADDPWGEPVPAGDVFQAGDFVEFGKASWDGGSLQIALSASTGGGPPDLYLSTCVAADQASAGTRSTE